MNTELKEWFIETAIEKEAARVGLLSRLVSGEARAVHKANKGVSAIKNTGERAAARTKLHRRLKVGKLTGEGSGSRLIKFKESERLRGGAVKAAPKGAANRPATVIEDLQKSKITQLSKEKERMKNIAIGTGVIGAAGISGTAMGMQKAASSL